MERIFAVAYSWHGRTSCRHCEELTSSRELLAGKGVPVVLDAKRREVVTNVAFDVEARTRVERPPEVLRRHGVLPLNPGGGAEGE
jgi:hypothetical protein